jgi:hypothetical protein
MRAVSGPEMRLECAVMRQSMKREREEGMTEGKRGSNN